MNICSNYVIQTCQYGPESQRNVEEPMPQRIEPFLRGGGLIKKWPVSVYIFPVWLELKPATLSRSDCKVRPSCNGTRLT